MPIENLMNATTPMSVQSLSSFSPVFVLLAAIVLAISILITVSVVLYHIKWTAIGAGLLIALAAVLYGIYRLFIFSKSTVTKAVTGDPTQIYWIVGIAAFLIASMFLGKKVDKILKWDEGIKGDISNKRKKTQQKKTS